MVRATVRASFMAWVCLVALGLRCRRSTCRAVRASVKASIMAGRTTHAGRYLPAQDLDHGHGFALVLASSQQAGRCWPVSRLRPWPGEPLTPGATCQIKTSIMVTGSPWCVPPSGLRCRRSTGRAVPASVKTSIMAGRYLPVQDLDHGRANHSRRAMRASSRPRSWSRVRLGAGQRSTGRAMLARSRPRSWSRVRFGACQLQGFICWGFDAPVNRPGDACQCQDLIHGHAGQRSTGRAVLASVKASIMAGRTTRAGQCWPD